MAEWQLIESAPKTRSTQLLLWFPWSHPGTGTMFIGAWGHPTPEHLIGQCWVDPDDGEPLGEPTHWQPLPEPPIGA